MKILCLIVLFVYGKWINVIVYVCGYIKSEYLIWYLNEFDV